MNVDQFEGLAGGIFSFFQTSIRKKIDAFVEFSESVQIIVLAFGGSWRNIWKKGWEKLVYNLKNMPNWATNAYEYIA